MDRKFRDPRSNKIYTESQIKRIQGNFLPNGLHKKYLEAYSEEPQIKKVVEKEANTKEVKAEEKDDVVKSKDSNGKK